MLSLKVFCILITLSSVYCVNNKNYFDLKLKNITDENILRNIIVKRYDGRIRNVYNLLINIEQLTSIDLIVYGYKILFNEMKLKNDLYTPEIMSFAYRIHSLDNTIKTENTKKLLSEIKSNLPESVKNFPFDTNIFIQNVHFNEYLKAGDNHTVFNDLRRPIFTESSMCEKVLNCLWEQEIVSKQKLFRLKNLEYNEYLYPEGNEFQYDGSRRNIFTNSVIKKIDEINWEFEPVESTAYFRIKNVCWDEYLYAPVNGFIDSSGRRPVFSWKPKGCDGDACYWKVIGEIEFLERFGETKP